MVADEKKIFGHPRGLPWLFFIEMWERLAFYTMLNVLLLYAKDFERGGLALPSGQANEIYGFYLAFVYFTPFVGGILADRMLGYRRSVLIGGLVMAGGLIAMSVPGTTFFYSGLVLLVLGNGLFKPNISVMVGNLYAAGDPKRDSGFNIFYMGINIGAFLASFLSSGIRNTYGWLMVFRVAGFGLILGVIILLLGWKVLAHADRQPEKDPNDAGFGAVAGKILMPALVVGVITYVIANKFIPDFAVTPATMGFIIGMIPVIIYFIRLPRTVSDKERPGMFALLPIYVAGGTFFMVLHLNGSAMTQWAADDTARDIAAPAAFQQDALPTYYKNAGEDVPRPAEANLVVVEDPAVVRMFGQKRMDEQTLAQITARYPELELRDFDPKAQATDFSGEEAALFQFATAIYADGKVEVVEEKDAHGVPSYSAKIPEREPALRRVAFMRKTPGGEVFPTYLVTQDSFDEIYSGYEARFGHPPEQLEPGKWLPVINPELFQSLNALFVVAFTPLIVLLFGWISARKNVTTAQKVFYGLCLTTVSLLLMALAGLASDGGAMRVSGWWLVGFYAIITAGELLISPMGLSLVTKLAPKRLVGLAMGGWFLATAFGNKFSGFFGGIQHMMSPVAFFLVLAGLAAAVAVFIRLLLPKLDAAIEGLS
ncbi:MFS transporter [Pseudenhygromyxa sp. WMMC2535]|uniref:oligopeptide:H+ symporter n=1 Tax=Pseudenhygromyxa sp. WMMC2535 TaxID=2712867 RepID=UPI0015522E3A|nr:MFS transporter [Pseudenhygromyxa sp. WMMC2535]NVB43583.1 MFS transporter [Pseudenhygromyxa sp. WMMC2535]